MSGGMYPRSMHGAISICPNVDLARPATAPLISPQAFRKTYYRRRSSPFRVFPEQLTLPHDPDYEIDETSVDETLERISNNFNNQQRRWHCFIHAERHAIRSLIFTLK